MQFGIGIIGATGYIGTPYREEIRGAGDAARIVALCARRRDLLEEAGQLDQAELLTDDWRAVVDHPDVNLVIVATPDALHIEPALATAAAGKHILCEKPVGMNCDEAEQIWRAFEGTSLAHYVPYWTRYVPVFAKTREVIQTGRLGEIRSVIYRWHNPRPASMPFTWRDNAELSSAGSIADVGSHAYDTMRWIMQDEAERILAHADVITDAKPNLGDINLEEALVWGEGNEKDAAEERRKGTAYDYAAIAFQWKGGAVGSLVLSHAPYLRKGFAPELEFHGTDASLSIDRISGRLMIADGAGLAEPFEECSTDAWTNRFSQFVFPEMSAQLESGSMDHPNLYDGWRVQAFTDAAARSASTGDWIEI